MKVIVFGGSRNIGYFSALRLLEKGATVTFLLRSPSVFDNDDKIKAYVASGHARLVQGDALNADDVRRAWEKAGEGEPDLGTVDVCLFTVGTIPKFSLTKGVYQTPADLCTRSMLNVLSTAPKPSKTKFIALSSNGIGKSSHATLPLPLKPVYNILIATPHKDKLGLERVLAHVVGRPWVKADMGDEPSAEFLPSGWESTPGLPGAGELKEVVLLRPALFTDGECKGDSVKGKEPYRVVEGNLPGLWTVSRKDVAHFIVEGLLEDWKKWEGKIVTMGY
ncbi:hypothetical protein JAAARDRAFT_124535 [Jaapia argillacea MUCL 33604]|uniref:NAD(P)-binding domain-containing protein n=1 Tax=Jaapia argillacea MUCL 33604 TaxID=933084 RepID=A0A067QFA6_9AGAM|nr:hypothetical protein JAAARDRAFT_124535 [Jaapia argillacea MUCL 33604]